MGNYVSCTLSTPVGWASSRGTKVIFPSGELRPLHEPVKAAELMLELPNSFLVNARSLQIGKRFSALNADEDLEMGNVYVFFPMSRVNAVVTAADMGALFLAANASSSAKRRLRGGSVRILPECGGGGDSQIARSSTAAAAAAPKLNFEDIEDFSAAEFKHRLSMCRSKKPLLETIVEEPIAVR